MCSCFLFETEYLYTYICVNICVCGRSIVAVYRQTDNKHVIKRTIRSEIVFFFLISWPELWKTSNKLQSKIIFGHAVNPSVELSC